VSGFGRYNAFMRSRREPVRLRTAAAISGEHAVSEPSLFELRAYATRRDRRDVLVGMFEDLFLDAYEAAGARVLGTFRDLDEPDRWVWMRAFADARARGDALENFYSSEPWNLLRDAANATIADTSNVLLLRLVSGAMPESSVPTPDGAAEGLVVSCVYPLGDGAEGTFAARFAELAEPVLRVLDGEPFAAFLSDRRENFYPRQRVRGESVFVTLTRFHTREAHEAFVRRRDASPAWRARVAPALGRLAVATPGITLLSPTARSRIR